MLQLVWKNDSIKFVQNTTRTLNNDLNCLCAKASRQIQAREKDEVRSYN